MRVPILMPLLGLAFVAGSHARGEERLPRVLFLTHSVGYVHGVVRRPEAETHSHAERRLVKALAGRVEVVASQDAAELQPERLAGYDAVVFYTTGELPVDTATRTALLDWVSDGGAFVGIHPATDTLYTFPAYGRMVGGVFDGHPWHQKVRVKVEDPDHPSTRHLGEAFEITDEIYQFKDWSREDVRVLLSLDVSSVDLDKPGVHRDDGDFALSWTRAHGLGRVFYTALGHRPEVWDDPRFLEHVAGGLFWALEGRTDPARRDAESFVEVHERLDLAAGERVVLPQGPRDFVLRLDVTPNDEASALGIGVRVRDDGEAGARVRFGGVAVDASDRAPLPLGPPKTSSALEVVGTGSNLTLLLDGRQVAEVHGVGTHAGAIALEAEGGTGLVLERVRIRALPEGAHAFHVLFAGDKTGWRMCGPGAFELVDGQLMATGGMGMLWHEKELENFVLLLDWQVQRREDNAGVFVRFPDPGDDPWVAVNKGYELQICDAAPPKHRTGSIYSFQDASEVPTHEVGRWNHYEIRVVGQHYTVKVNGVTVNRFDGERSSKGHVGLQNHDDASRVRFRNVRVVELR